ncbi:hypothetical protein V9T40_013196 [Parthenolecanium corni]|uniref:Uncharacterized protein n=1 Tax=Parthenolecanium corni TaxID=536013 RepID=A0AAN9TKX5_9HEMI
MSSLTTQCSRPRSLMESILIAKMESASLAGHSLVNGYVSPGATKSLMRADSLGSTSSFASTSSIGSDYCRCDDCLLGIVDLNVNSAQQIRRKKVNKRATGVGDEANELPFKNRMANAPSIFLFFDDFSRLYMNLGIRVNPSRKLELARVLVNGIAWGYIVQTGRDNPMCRETGEQNCTLSVGACVSRVYPTSISASVPQRATGSMHAPRPIVKLRFDLIVTSVTSYHGVCVTPTNVENAILAINYST